MDSEHWSVKGSQIWLSLCFVLPNIRFCLKTSFSVARTLVFITATLARKRHIGSVSESWVSIWEFSVASELILSCPAKPGELRVGMWMRQSWGFRAGYKEAEGGCWRRWTDKEADIAISGSSAHTDQFPAIRHLLGYATFISWFEGLLLFLDKQLLQLSWLWDVPDGWDDRCDLGWAAAARL